jgi:hypothetical protein
VEQQPVGAPLSRDFIPGRDANESEVDAFLSKRERRAKERHQEEADRATEASWRQAERRAEAKRREHNRQSYLDSQRHLRSVYLGLYFQKDALVKRLEGGE